MNADEQPFEPLWQASVGWDVTARQSSVLVIWAEKGKLLGYLTGKDSEISYENHLIIRSVSSRIKSLGICMLNYQVQF